MTTYKVVLTAGGRAVDSLTGVMSPLPLAISDTEVWGLRQTRGHADEEFFRWSGPGRVTAWPLPDDVLSDYHDVAIAPRGGAVAYVALMADGRPRGMVRQEPGGAVVWAGPVVGGCDCDVDLSHARWISPDSFEIAVVSTADRRGWAVSRGSLARRTASFTYQDSEPAWDARR